MKEREITKRKNSIKEEMLTKQKGITLIALVVTIIILLILAGVAINAAIGENGLFSKSRQSVERHKEEAAREKISMSIGEFLLDINSREMTEEEKDNHLKELLGKLGPTSVATDSSYYETEIDGYLFWVNKETLEIESKGTATEIKPETITVNETEIEIIVGHTEIIDMTVTPQEASGKYIKYTSSNEEVAKVKNGTITGVGKGTAIITIESTEDSKIKATITVTVKEVEAEGISIQPETLGLKVGETSEELQVTFTPWDTADKTIIWSTDSASIATVDSDGKVTGASVGTATITATTLNGKTATCEVTVSEIEVESISINPTTLEVSINEEKDLPTVEITPENATNQTITWSISPEGVATIDEANKKITGVAEGTATITATSSNGKTATCEVTVPVLVPTDPEIEIEMDINVVKKAIERDGLQKWLGQKVSYSPEGGGTWRVFYYNTTDEWGDPAETIYIKRDYDSKLQKTLKTSTATTNGTNYMKNMNPLWTANEVASAVDTEVDRSVAWLCDPDNWAEYKTESATYAIGSPSIEMYMKSYNIWKDSNTALTCEIKYDEGYKVASSNYKIEAGPGNIYNGSFWLASPSEVYCGGLYVNNEEISTMEIRYKNESGVCPIVSINP